MRRNDAKRVELCECCGAALSNVRATGPTIKGFGTFCYGECVVSGCDEGERFARWIEMSEECGLFESSK